jgi:predicted Zn-dependent protease
MDFDVTSTLNERKEPLWMGIFSWQVGLAVFAVCVLWMTIIKPDNIQMVSDKSSFSGNDLSLCSLSILDDLDNAPAAKLLRDGKTEEAITAANQLLQQNPYDVRTLMIAGNVLSSTSDPGKGIALLRKSTYMCPQSRYVRLNYARYLVKEKMYDDAIVQYETLCKKFPEDWTTPHAELAELYVKKNEFKNAADELHIVCNNDTRNGAARKRLGMAMAAASELQDGFEEFIRGCNLQLQEGMSPGLKLLVDKSGSPAKAEEILKEKVAANPDQINNLLLLGELYVTMQRLPDAKSLLSTELKHSPLVNRNADVHFLFAEILDRSGDPKAAKDTFAKGAKLMVNTIEIK